MTGSGTFHGMPFREDKFMPPEMMLVMGADAGRGIELLAKLGTLPSWRWLARRRTKRELGQIQLGILYFKNLNDECVKGRKA